MAKKQKQNNYLDACQKLGIDPQEEPKTESYPGEVHDYHYHVLRVCIAAENAIEQPDGSFIEWKAKNDGTELTYEPRFYKPGSVWAYHYCEDWITHTNAGPRHKYKSFELMKSSVKKLSTEYNNLFNS